MKHIGRKLFHLLGGLGLLSLNWLLGPRNALTGYGLIDPLRSASGFSETDRNAHLGIETVAAMDQGAVFHELLAVIRHESDP
jgi:hypothetical protein